MQNGAKVFGLNGEEALAIYMACTTMLAMMVDGKVEHPAVASLESAVQRWYAFCTSRGLQLPEPKEAAAGLQRTEKVKIL